MHDSYLLLTPLLTLLVVALVGFVGCDLLFGLDEVHYYAPRNLTATPGFNEIVLDWDPPTEKPNLTTYRVYRHEEGQAYQPLQDITDGPGFTDNVNVVNGMKYWYQVASLLGAEEREKSNEIMVTAGPAGLTDLITSFQRGPSMPRKDFTGLVGMQITVGQSPIVVKTLGRYKVPGNTRTHFVKLVDAASRTDVPMGGVPVDLTTGADATFVYALLPQTVTLLANTSYFVVSEELANGDEWYDADTTVSVDQMLALVTQITPVNRPDMGNYAVSMATPFSYGPVNLQY